MFHVDAEETLIPRVDAPARSLFRAPFSNVSYKPARLDTDRTAREARAGGSGMANMPTACWCSAIPMLLGQGLCRQYINPPPCPCFSEGPPSHMNVVRPSPHDGGPRERSKGDTKCETRWTCGDDRWHDLVRGLGNPSEPAEHTIMAVPFPSVQLIFLLTTPNSLPPRERQPLAIKRQRR